MMSRLEAEIRSLAAQVTNLTSVATKTQSALEGHAELQTIRTANRDKEMASVRERLDAHEQAIATADRWRWTMVGRMAGIMAGAGAGGAGLVTAALRMWTS